MTKASASRKVRNAVKVDAPTFAMPPPGMMSEQVDLPEYHIVLGLLHPEDSPLLVCVWNGKELKKLLPEDAAHMANDLALTPGLAPAVAAIRAMVKRAGDIALRSMTKVNA